MAILFFKSHFFDFRNEILSPKLVKVPNLNKNGQGNKKL